MPRDGDRAQTGDRAGTDARGPARDGVDLIIEQWRRERPELDHAPIGVVGRISRLARELEARLEPVYRDHGLEPGWHDILATLRRHGAPFRLRPTDLTNASMLTSSGTTKRLDRLEQAGLIARSPDPGDRRGTLITLTDAGRELIDRLTPAHLENERTIIAALGEAEQRALADLLRKLQLGLPAGANRAPSTSDSSLP
jgi:DNA-binding MarR family transcriptional regulator